MFELTYCGRTGYSVFTLSLLSPFPPSQPFAHSLFVHPVLLTITLEHLEKSEQTEQGSLRRGRVVCTDEMSVRSRLKNLRRVNKNLGLAQQRFSGSACMIECLHWAIQTLNTAREWCFILDNGPQSVKPVTDMRRDRCNC